MATTLRRTLATILTTVAVTTGFIMAAPALSLAAPSPAGIPVVPQTLAVQSCGDKSHGGPVHVSIDLNCTGKGNPILDMLFGIIHWLSDGVGLVVIASVIVGGIQYTTSRDNPQATSAAVKRLQSALMALLIFIFGYAILNYLIPGAILR